jgi:hypothetical protein
MWSLMEGLIARFCLMLHNRAIGRALALHRRGEVRSDGLLPLNVSNCVEIEWHARRVHPWDRDRARFVQQELFVQQSLADAEAALIRLFAVLPYVDAIRLQILDPDSDEELVAGMVYRKDMAELDKSISVGMRLIAWGLRFHSTGYTLEPLQADCSDETREIGRSAIAELVCTYRKSTVE